MTPTEADVLYYEKLRQVAFSRGEDFPSAEAHLMWARDLMAEVPSSNDLVDDWVLACIGPKQAYNKTERIYRFFEEACELAQACDMTEKEARQLIRYVWNRSVGQIEQEVGGVFTTLHALCNAFNINTYFAGTKEITRAWGKIDAIRQKHLNKPRRSPLPGQVKEYSPLFKKLFELYAKAGHQPNSGAKPLGPSPTTGSGAQKPK